MGYLEMLRVKSKSIVLKMGSQDSSCAVKIMPRSNDSIYELRTMLKFEHPNVIHLLGWFETDSFIAVVMPGMNMDLGDYVNMYRISWPAVMDIAVQLVKGLCHIHDCGYAHFDIKPQNVGVRGNGPTAKFRMMDLGSARMLQFLKKGDQIQTTPDFRAPELVGGVFTSACDVYSMGMVLIYVSRRVACKTNPPRVLELLMGEMTDSDYRRRPSTHAILRTISSSVWIAEGPLWLSAAANIMDGDAAVLADSNLTTMLEVGQVENAFWLLQERARRKECAFELLPRFHGFLFSKFSFFLYTRAVEFLSHDPNVLLTPEIIGHLRAASCFPCCQQAVIRILARKLTPSLSGCDGPWGSHQQPFMQFVARFAADSSCMCRAEAASFLE